MAEGENPRRRRPNAKGKGGAGQKTARPRKRTSLAAENKEIERLEAWIAAGAPVRGSNPLAADLLEDQPAAGGKNEKSGTRREDDSVSRSRDDGEEEGGDGKSGRPAGGNSKDAKTGEFRPFVGAKFFDVLPLSTKTKKGLQDSNFTHMTAIQRAAIPHALAGRDVLGAAKTGSGKTLAFLVPLLERLFRQRWSSMDGIGAIIISPTRELASQIFAELQKVGRHHGLSGGLLIGGRAGSLEAEKERVGALNIVCCTPGRLLQHMDETPGFDCSNLQVLVLDEADRILDLGFSSSLDAILRNLPPPPLRQTLLFSATQTRSVRDLARLSLSHPEYVAVHERAAAATPLRLQQTAMVVPAGGKLDVLWSFLRTHTKAKTLVFLSSCKQVKFVFESFCRLRPGLPLKLLHGRMKQLTRLAVFHDFCDASAAALFATDVAARGLDFPAVDWVVQVDCPDDVATYIHRVGRTARFNAAGRSLLLLLPSEKEMLPALEAAKVPIKVTKPNPARLQSVSASLSSLLSGDPHLKYLAQRSLVTYLRSVFVQGNKAVFDVTKIPVDELAASLGLPNPPKIRFLKKVDRRKNMRYSEQAGAQEGRSGDESSDEGSDSGNEGELEGGREGREGALSQNGRSSKGDLKEKKKQQISEMRGIADRQNHKMRFEEDDDEEGERDVMQRRSVADLWTGHEEEGGGGAEAAHEAERHDGLQEESDNSSDEEEQWGKKERMVTAREEVQLSNGEGEVGELREEGREEQEGGLKVQTKDQKRRKSKIERLFGRKNRDVLSSAYERLRDKVGAIEGRSDGEEEGDLELKPKVKAAGGDDHGARTVRTDLFDSEEENEESATLARDIGRNLLAGEEEAIPVKPLSRKQRKKLLAGPGKHGGTKVVFDDDGNMLPPLAAFALRREDGIDGASGQEGELELSGKQSLNVGKQAQDAAEARFERLRQEMKERDRLDRLAEKQRLRERRQKAKEKTRKRKGVSEATVATLGDGHMSEEDREIEKALSTDSMERMPEKKLRTENMDLEEQEKLVLSLLDKI